MFVSGVVNDSRIGAGSTTARRPEMKRRFVAVLAVTALAVGVMSALGTSRSGAASSVLCQKAGHVVWMRYFYAPSVSGTCWDTEYPHGNTCVGSLCPAGVTYTLCRRAGLSGDLGSGSWWTYDDTNVTASPSDSSTDANVCNGRQNWQYEFMAHNGGYHYAWNPTFAFEENYDSTTFFYSYTSTNVSAEPGTNASPPLYNWVPTINTDASNLKSHIEALCYKSPDYVDDYYIGIYNPDTPSSTQMDAIKAALNFCYHT